MLQRTHGIASIKTAHGLSLLTVALGNVSTVVLLFQAAQVVFLNYATFLAQNSQIYKVE